MLGVAPVSSAMPGALTERQHQVIALIAAGMTTEQIGLELGISSETVKQHTENLLRRLDAKNRAQAVHHAWLVGWLPVR